MAKKPAIIWGIRRKGKIEITGTTRRYVKAKADQRWFEYEIVRFVETPLKRKRPFVPRLADGTVIEPNLEVNIVFHGGIKIKATVDNPPFAGEPEPGRVKVRLTGTRCAGNFPSEELEAWR